MTDQDRLMHLRAAALDILAEPDRTDRQSVVLGALRFGATEPWSALRTPYSVIAMTGLASIAGWCGLRLLWSGMVTRAERRAHPRPDLHGSAVICGAGSAGQRIEALRR